MAENVNATNAFENVINVSVQLPGVKVNRENFLRQIFAKYKDKNIDINKIVEKGPVAAGCDRELLKKISDGLIMERTSESSIASFCAGLPGGIAMAATIPIDLVQFFGMTLRLAQEIPYLYGADGMYDDKVLNDEKVKNQLILYIGAMFGVEQAIKCVQILSRQVAKTVIKELPKKALTKTTFWYPIIKQICKFLGIKITKESTAKAIAKALPVIGGVVSGILNFASMKPLASRLQSTLDKAAFNYTEKEMEQDIIYVTSISQTEESEQTVSVN